MSELELKAAVEARMSQKRFIHTLGVVKAAKKLGEELLPEKLQSLVAAAFLHDVAKEIPAEELVSLSSEYGYKPTEEDKNSPQVMHSFAAPAVILRDFPEYASEDVLSAVFKHTTGDSEMSVFDEIIFLSDYVEEGREYPSCIAVRELLWSEMDRAVSREEKETALHRAALRSIEETLSSLNARGKHIHTKTMLAKDFIERKILGN